MVAVVGGELVIHILPQTVVCVLQILLLGVQRCHFVLQLAVFLDQMMFRPWCIGII